MRTEVCGRMAGSASFWSRSPDFLRILHGTAPAEQSAMAGARHFRQLVIWRLADQTRQLVFALTRRPAFRHDSRLRSQLDDAIDSVCRNTAEGFAGESHADFAHYLKIARKSLNEVMDCLQSALHKRYVTPADVQPIYQLSRRTFGAIAGMLRHLERTNDNGEPKPPSTAPARRSGRDHP